MLSSDYLLFEYFKNKGMAWSSKNESAVDYLSDKSSNDLSNEFKGDESFKSVISYIDSIKKDIFTSGLASKKLKIPTGVNKRDNEKVIELTNKLNQAISEAIPHDKTSSKETIAISLASYIAIAVILSTNNGKKERKVRKSKFSYEF